MQPLLEENVMGIMEDYNWKREWAIANLEEELWQRRASYDPGSWNKGVKVERLPSQIKAMQDHLQLDIKRVLYRMHGKPFLEYRFYAIAKAFDYEITGAPIETANEIEPPKDNFVVANSDRSHIRLVKPIYKI
jgi:hypothetical protein